MFHVFAALIEFECDLLIERTNAGLEAARKRGARIGRSPALTPAQIKHARKLIDAGERPVDVARTLGGQSLNPVSHFERMMLGPTASRGFSSCPHLFRRLQSTMQNRPVKRRCAAPLDNRTMHSRMTLKRKR